MDKKELIAEAWKRARYAHASYSRELVYEANGYCKALVDSGAVEWEDVREIAHYLTAQTLNDGDWIREEQKRTRSLWDRKIWRGE